MNDKVEETVFNKTPGLNNPETYVLVHNRFNIYLVLIFSVLNKTQVYKMPYRDSPHHEIEINMNFTYRMCLNQVNTQKIITLQSRTLKSFYSKLEI